MLLTVYARGLPILIFNPDISPNSSDILAASDFTFSIRKDKGGETVYPALVSTLFSTSSFSPGAVAKYPDQQAGQAREQ